ncbi:MAG TPA: hypothetical protein VKE74_19625 [Gemmataceae bacterium]|nr:hypothetical protein [Gemmataceae bacterium]
MRSILVLVVGLLTAAGLVGCGQEKQLPDAVAVSPAETPDTGPAVPAASEEKAKEWVDRYLKAATGGDPTRLAKARVTKMTLSGMMQLPAGEDQTTPGGLVRVENSRVIEAAWPDRIRSEDVFQSRSLRPMTTGIRRPAVWSYQKQPTGDWQALPLSQELEQVTIIEFIGNYWMPLLVPLTEPGTIVFDARTTSIGQQPAETVKVSVKDCPVFTLWFDPKTDYLMRIDYVYEQSRRSVPNVVMLSGHRSFDGLTLPGMIGYTRNGIGVAEWKVESLEFPPQIDSTRFDPPKAEEKK